MPAAVKQVTIGPPIRGASAGGTMVDTEGYDIDSRLTGWGYEHRTVCHAEGGYARDDDGGGSRAVHVNTLEGFWSLPRGWLRPHRGASQEKLPLYRGFFGSIHNVRARGRCVLGSRMGLSLSPPRNPS